ncbi:MAG: hypothetical protein AB1505_21765 [Candidatus Latescibacterota bacterium]
MPLGGSRAGHLGVAGLLVVLLAPARSSAAPADATPRAPQVVATGLPPAGWARRVAPDTAATPTRARPSRTGLRREEGLRLTRAVWAGGVLSLSAGALAWWSQDRADRAYDRYMRSAGVARQARWLARAEDDDRVAGVAFLGMEAGLVLAAYHLFF